MATKPKTLKASQYFIAAITKPVVIALLALIVLAAPTFAAQKKSPSASETGYGNSQVQTNAYTALYWNFGASGRKYAQGDTLTFVSDSINGTFVRTRDIGPKARNSTAVNLVNPDSLGFCVEMVRVDADTNTTLAFFQASVNGGNYFPFPVAQAGTTTEVGPSLNRGMYCVTRKFVPGLYLKPQQVITTATDTNTIYSALLFGIYK